MILSPALLILGLAAIGALTKSAQPAASPVSPTTSSTNTDAPPAASPDSPTTSSTNTSPAPAALSAETNDHQLHLTPNLFGRGALSDGRTYSVTLIDSNKEQIPPATTLFVQGVILGNFDTDVIILADEQEKSDKILCAMSSDESEDVRYYYRAGEAVRITGGFGMTNFGVPVLRGCTVASATSNVVRPSHDAPEVEQPVPDTNAHPDTPSADTVPQTQPEVIPSNGGEAQEPAPR